MTPEERARALHKQWQNRTMWKEEMILDIEKAIEAAEEERAKAEREACALIAKEERDHHCKAMMEGPQSGLVFQAENGACATANTIWTRIRSRSS